MSPSESGSFGNRKLNRFKCFVEQTCPGLLINVRAKQNYYFIGTPHKMLSNFVKSHSAFVENPSSSIPLLFAQLLKVTVYYNPQAPQTLFTSLQSVCNTVQKELYHYWLVIHAPLLLHSLPSLPFRFNAVWRIPSSA